MTGSTLRRICVVLLLALSSQWVAALSPLMGPPPADNPSAHCAEAPRSMPDGHISDSHILHGPVLEESPAGFNETTWSAPTLLHGDCDCPHCGVCLAWVPLQPPALSNTGLQTWKVDGFSEHLPPNRDPFFRPPIRA